MCHYGSLKIYADDATLYARVNTLEDAKKLQADLDNIYHWSIAWQLHLNIKNAYLCGFVVHASLIIYTV